MQPGTVLAVLVAVGNLFADTYGSSDSVVWNQNTQCCRPSWGLPVHSTCTLDLTWELIAEKLTNKTIDLKTGGLGTSMISGEVEVWLCVFNHTCDADGGSFCFVYDETQEKFLAWGANSQLSLFNVTSPPPPPDNVDCVDVGSGCEVSNDLRLIDSGFQIEVAPRLGRAPFSKKGQAQLREEAGDFIYTEEDD